ncbi:hemerythrin domain-containing protein [Candidatus Rariloculus sp.]|uniref:hemerythrin domain-containing protein n=1 Tax=Candidatus Rariloculus sp. TaxID=3101265 RepID=UPI003D0C33FE
MAAIIDDLHQDHVNAAQVLKIAERTLGSVEAGEDADFSLLEDAMRYITGYSDTHHHPVEDIVFRQLRKRSPQMAAEIDAIAAEHDSIIMKGKRFLDSVAAVEEGALVPRSALVNRGREYLSTLSKHMDLEESTLFPAAATMLDESDWESVSKRIDCRPDPLFGTSLDEDYRRLWKLIQLHDRD